MNTLSQGQVPTIFHYPEEPDGMTRDYCFVYDVVRANILALQRADNQIVNIGTSRETTTGELYRKILEKMRRYGYCGDSKFDSPNKGPARAGDLRRSALSYDRAQEVLGWSPEYDLDRGIDETIKREIIEKQK
jgi:UDP-glucose 4-epimerase